MTRREKTILAAVSLCHGLVHSYMLVFPTIYNSLGSALNLKFSGVGFIGMASYMAFGFGALPTGFLVDRLGARRLLVVCIAGMALSSLVAFLAHNTAGVVIALVLMGLFGSLYHPSGLALISTSIKDLGKALGIHGTAGTVGEAGAPILAGVITARLGWNYSYLALGVLGTAALVFLTMILRQVKADPHGRVEVEHAEPAESGLGRDLVAIYAMGALYGLTYRVLMTFFPSYLAERVAFVGADVKRLGMVTSAVMAASLVGPILGGYLASSRRAIERNLLVVFTLLAALALGFYFLDNIGLILVAAPAVLLVFSFQPLQNVLVAKASHSSFRGRAYGINSTVSFGIGSLAAGAGGVFGERFGIRSVFLLMFALCLAQVVLVATVRRRRMRLARGPVNPELRRVT
jgi:MFS family permease